MVGETVYDIIKELSGDIVFVKEETPKQGKNEGIPRNLHSSLYFLAKLQHPKGLYSHQYKCIKSCLEGKNIAINTSTASGKSLCFLLPALNELLSNPTSRCLFIYPIKALANDQIKKMLQWTKKLGLGDVVQKFDGDVKGKGRLEAIKQGRLLVATPDILHMTLLRNNKEEYYRDLFSNLKYVLLDECHTYNGAFGSHMAMVIRRLNQVCRNHNNTPQYILSSATIGSPQEHIKTLTGLNNIQLISEEDNGSPVAGKSLYMVKPPQDSAVNTFVLKLVKRIIEADYRFLIFCNTRKEVESLNYSFGQNYPKYKEFVRPYRAGFEAEDRVAIENALGSRKLKGVFCTSALEMGIDLPEMDVCVMIGLPGNKIGMIQRAGRVGRKNPGSVIVLSSNSPYDHYYFDHPGELFDKSLEKIAINIENKQVLLSHYACARAEAENFENPLMNEDIFGTNFIHLSRQIHLYDYPEEILYENIPHFKVSIRCVEDPTYTIILGWNSNDPQLGQINYSQILREAYVGAIYLHMGKKFRVKSICYAKKQVFVDARCSGAAQTKPKSDVFVKPRISGRSTRSKVWPGIKVWDTPMSITERVVGYTETIGKEKEDYYYEQPMMRYFVTSGTVISITGLKSLSHGAIMGLATAMENAYPILYNCSKEDISSFAWSKENNEGYIYLFDSTAGGLGITQQVVSLFEEFLGVVTHNVINCPHCSSDNAHSKTGCFKCVLSNPWFNYPESTRQDTINLLNEVLEVTRKNRPQENTAVEEGLNNDLLCCRNENAFGGTMIVNGSVVFTGKHQQGIVLGSKIFNNGLLTDRLYEVQVGSKKEQYLGNKLTLIQGSVERYCLNCGGELIGFEETTCPLCEAQII